jgi:hypothetical protein
MIARLTNSMFALLLTLPLALAPAFAQDGKLKKEELDQLLAPIALYPDDLLTNVLVASTYPLEVVQAARWKKDTANAKLKGDALTKALEAKDWDPSIKSLVQFPDVLQQMSDKLDWTQKLGDAFLAQQDEVMDQIQFLRSKAADAGNLKSNKQQKVTKDTSGGGSPVYVIESANPEVVYVPTYQPTVVYGPWWYDDYPPYYWNYPGADYVGGWWWGRGVAIAAGIWGWGHWNWHDHDIDIDVNKWNNINVDRDRITNKKWEHNPAHRGNVPYKGKDVREKFMGGDRQIGDKEFRGKDIDRSKIESKLKDSDHSQIKDKIGDKAGDRDRDAIKDKLGEGGAGQKIKDKAGDGAGAKIKDKAGDRAKPSQKPAQKVSRDVDRPKAKKPSPGAFDVKKGSNVKKAANRGHSSRVAMGGGGGRPSVSRGGGGGRGGGRGGGGRGGGRRSDISVKHDIVLLGRFENGMGFYRFAYNGSQKQYVGVIAQEAMKVMPEAVSRDGEGYLRVDYGRLGLRFQTYDRWLEFGARMPKLSPQ